MSRNIFCYCLKGEGRSIKINKSHIRRQPVLMCDLGLCNLSLFPSIARSSSACAPGRLQRTRHSFPWAALRIAAFVRTSVRGPILPSVKYCFNRSSYSEYINIVDKMKQNMQNLPSIIICYSVTYHLFSKTQFSIRSKKCKFQINLSNLSEMPSISKVNLWKLRKLKL